MRGHLSLIPSSNSPESPLGVGRFVGVALALLFIFAFSSRSSAQIPVTVAWEPNNDGLTAGYEVAVGFMRGIPAARLDVGPATSVTLPLPPGAVYYVSVRAYTAARIFGPGTPDALVDVSSAPGVPSGLRSSVTGNVATLSWSPPEDGGVPSRYLLSVGTAPGGNNILSEASVGNQLSISGPIPAGVYYARVQAANSVGIGPPTGDVVLRVGAISPPPATPTGVGISASGRTVSLGWRPVAGATAYLVEAGSSRGATNLGVFNIGGATSLVTSVPPGTYFVRIRAMNAGGVSSPSADVSVQVR